MEDFEDTILISESFPVSVEDFYHMLLSDKTSFWEGVNVAVENTGKM
jgi:hypothetical protein